MKKHLSRFLPLVPLLPLMLLFSAVNVKAETKLEHVHNMSHSVMPFDMAKTVHVFKMTDSGGIEKIIVRNTIDVDQVVLIQDHLRMESNQFQRGDYSDPALLHGPDMPGLRELQMGAPRIKVSYSSLPDGAEITFETTDLHLITAVHRWFGAQLSEHGADARAE